MPLRLNPPFFHDLLSHLEITVEVFRSFTPSIREVKGEEMANSMSKSPPKLHVLEGYKPMNLI
jgi:hypothetical protein